MKIDEDRQEIVLSDGRRLDIHSVERFLEKFTEINESSYVISRRLFDNKTVKYWKEIEECHDKIIMNEDESLPDALDKILEKYEVIKEELSILRRDRDETDEVKEKMNEFIIEWGTFLKNVDYSLNMDDNQRMYIDNIINSFFEFDFGNLQCNENTEDNIPEDIPF